MRWNGTRDLQKNQAKRLIDESPELLKSVVKFALVTVLRKSNIINLEWQQIDMQRQVARVDPEDSKSNRAIGVALNDTASKVLRDQTGKASQMWVYIPGRLSEQMEHQCLRSGRCALTARQHGYQLVVVQELKISVSMTSGIPGQQVDSVRRPIISASGNGRMGSREMVRRYAHLAP